jgi:hypothetical protein
MKIEDTWKSLEKDGDRLTGVEIRAGLHQKGEDAVQKLNKRLAWKIAFTLMFTPLYIIAYFFVDDWLPKLLFAIITFTHLGGLVFFTQRYRQAKAFNMAGADAKSTLNSYINNINATIRQEELGGLILYPIATACGFFLSLLQKMTWDEAIAKQSIWITLFILVIAITPISHWSAKWLNRKTFGKYLEILEERYAQLKDES